MKKISIIYETILTFTYIYFFYITFLAFSIKLLMKMLINLKNECQAKLEGRFFL